MLIRKCLPKYHLEILESVLKNYFTPRRLTNIFDFNNHQEHPIPKGILDYRPSIESPNQEQVTNNTQCSNMQKCPINFQVERKRNNLSLGLTMDQLSYAMETLRSYWSSMEYGGKLMKNPDSLKTAS